MHLYAYCLALLALMWFERKSNSHALDQFRRELDDWVIRLAGGSKIQFANDDPHSLTLRKEFYRSRLTIDHINLLRQVTSDHRLQQRGAQNFSRIWLFRLVMIGAFCVAMRILLSIPLLSYPSLEQFCADMLASFLLISAYFGQRAMLPQLWVDDFDRWSEWWGGLFDGKVAGKLGEQLKSLWDQEKYEGISTLSRRLALLDHWRGIWDSEDQEKLRRFEDWQPLAEFIVAGLLVILEMAPCMPSW